MTPTDPDTRKHVPTTPAKMWLLVADEGRARLFSADAARGPLHELHDIIDPEGRSRDQDLVTDRPGRTFDSGGEGRHAMEPSTEPTEVEAIGFAKRLAETMDAARTRGRFEHLGLVAAPGFLGHLRKSLSDELAKHVVLEVDKDLTRFDPPGIRKRLPDRLFSGSD
jgi:protein required for attachment to host cells